MPMKQENIWIIKGKMIKYRIYDFGIEMEIKIMICNLYTTIFLFIDILLIDASKKCTMFWMFWAREYNFDANFAFEFHGEFRFLKTAST